MPAAVTSVTPTANSSGPRFSLSSAVAIGSKELKSYDVDAILVNAVERTSRVQGGTWRREEPQQNGTVRSRGSPFQEGPDEKGRWRDRFKIWICTPEFGSGTSHATCRACLPCVPACDVCGLALSVMP